MRDHSTDAMAQLPSPDDATQGDAGLVLLYAERFEALPAAWPLRGDTVTIGRDVGVDIELAVNSVSRRHAELVRTSTGWRIRDLGSRNGILVDGVPVGAAELEPASELRIGDAILKVVVGEVEAHTRYRIDGVMAPGASRLCPHDTTLVGGLQMDRIAAHLAAIAPTELNVLLLGESGTGKEVAARDLHRYSGRRGAFCAINCAAIPHELLESELFGVRRGAFSGADRDRPGLVRAAHQGTLLLDEIGDMPLAAQVKLLRVIQSREVVPLGATTPERVDVRFVAATHRDVAQLRRVGSFRADLYARLGEATLRLPPLRERKEDLLLLLRTFLARMGRPELQPSLPLMIAALHYDWPLNVRELEACVKRAVALATGSVLTVEHLPDAVREAMLEYGRVASPAPTTVATPLGSAAGPPSEAELRALLTQHRGNVAAVGRSLGKARMQVHRWLRRYGIDLSSYR